VGQQSAYKAKSVRAAANLLCDIMVVPKIHNPLTFRLITSLEKVKSKGMTPARQAWQHSRMGPSFGWLALEADLQGSV